MMWSLLKIQRPVATLTDKCLVLDIDETLVHTFDDGERINKNMIWNDPNLLELRRRIYEIELIDIAGIRGKGDYYKMSGIMRPYLKNILIFHIQRILIIIFSEKNLYIEFNPELQL